MENLVKKYEHKLINAGLCDSKGPGRPIIGGLDDGLVWNRKTKRSCELEPVFNGLNINSLVLLEPASPYREIIRFLAQKALAAGQDILPEDCETKTFLHTLPVIDRFDAGAIIQGLKKRKCVIVLPLSKDGCTGRPAVIAQGTVSPEQGFATVSSVCFACFVKFFSDFLMLLRNRRTDSAMDSVYEKILPQVKPGPAEPQAVAPMLLSHPFNNEETVYSAIIEAGLKTVQYNLVDSYFGNVSYLWHNTLYISQTGSSLDELSGCIDPVPLDGSTSAGLTASSELSAHLKTVAQTRSCAILHGHPKFSVILSMDCDPVQREKCRFSDQCHTRCPEKRFAGSTPIVPGEVGTGSFGLCRTLPDAFKDSKSVIVYGHGLFTIGEHDFNTAFSALLEVETRCKNIYFDTVARLKKRF